MRLTRFWANRRSENVTMNWEHSGNRAQGRDHRRASAGKPVRTAPVTSRYGGFRFAQDDFGNAGFAGGRAGVRGQMPGNDIEGDILVTLDEASKGSLRTISLQRINSRTGQAETHTFKVRIPAGVHEGQIIRVPGKGEEGTSGGPPGDLYLRVRLAAHPDFQARDANLYQELYLAPWEGVLGANVHVPTLDGSVNLRIPPGTNNGQKLRLRGRGLPRGQNGERGDLYVMVNVQLPARVNQEEKELWEKLSRVSGFNPRAQ